AGTRCELRSNISEMPPLARLPRKGRIPCVIDRYRLVPLPSGLAPETLVRDVTVMFESLSNRLQDVFRQIRGEGRLTEETVELALREIRMALLEADVNFKVVKAFIDRVRDRSVDQEVLKSLTPDQQVVRIVRDEMLALFGDAQGGLPASGERPRVIMLLGLQGSGKTTTSAKLGRGLNKQGRNPRLVSTDVRRPAAIQQLSVVGKQAGVRVHDPAGEGGW